VLSALFFLEKSLAIVDESADNKRVSWLLLTGSAKNCLVHYTDLATKVFDILKIEIENRELTPGTKRKHIRSPYALRSL